MKKAHNSTIAGVLLFATAFAGTAAADTKYALSVGINEYSLAGCSTLHGCVNDAKYFHANLISLGDWSASNMTKLTDRSATKTAIRNAIAGYASRAVSGDTFVYMHSSHGGWNSGTSTYLCAHDDYYEDTELAADLARFPTGVKVVVVVDACHSGGLFKGEGKKTKRPTFDLAQRVGAIMDDNRAKGLANGEKGVLDKLASSEIGWVTAADYDESSYDGDSYSQGGVGAVFLCGFTEGWWNGQADTTGVGDGDGYMDGYEGWKYGYDYCTDQTPQCHNTNALRRVELGRSGTTPPPLPQERVRIAFNANGGSCGTTSRTIAEGTAIGTLPAAARRGYRLVGWYTARTGGERITASSTFSSGCTLYARWAKALYTVAFNANGGRGRMAAQRMTYGTASRLRANTFLRTGYVFIGWARTKGGAVAYANRQAVRNLRTDGRTTTLYAKWAKRTYKVAFNANGGTGRMAQQAFVYGRAGRLRANAFTRRGYTFGGWATTRTGDARYVNRQAVKNLRTDGRTTTLYAFWQLPLPTALDTSLAFATGGNARWFGQTTEQHDGTDAARSGKISHNQNSWMQTTVTGPGTVSFWWKVSCEEDYDYLQFFVDGVEQRFITGTRGTWTRVSLNIQESGTHVLKWNYHKDASDSAGSDRGWVDQVGWAPLRTCDLNTAMDNTSLSFSTDGSAPWFGQTSVSHDGADAAQSGTITDRQSTWMQTTVTGPGTVSFWWNVSSESGYDQLEFVVDGEQKAVISGTDGGWAQVRATVSGSGSHVLEWTYFKDESVSSGSDCGWVDQVSWSGSSTPPPEPISSPTNKFALCVGINEYSLGGCSTLSGCVNDAVHFHENLRNRGGWPEGNMTKLTNRGATKAAIRNAIARYASLAVSGNTFVYMHSSHGGWNSGTSTYLCAYNDYYEDTELAADLARFPAGVKVVVVVDACHSGGLFKGGGKAKAPAFDLAQRVSAIMDENRAKRLARGEKGVRNKLSSSEIGWVTAADYDESSYDGGSYPSGDVGGEFLCAFTEGWCNGQADCTEVGDGDGFMDGYEGWKYGTDACGSFQSPQYHNVDALRRVELGTCGLVQSCDLRTAVDNTSLSFTTGGSSPWVGQSEFSHDGVDAARSGIVTDNQSTWMQTTVAGPGTVSFWWNVSSESGYDQLSFFVDGIQKASISGTGEAWSQVTLAVSGSGSHTLKWTYAKDISDASGGDCGWVDQIVWSSTRAASSAEEPKAAEMDEETDAEDTESGIDAETDATGGGTGRIVLGGESDAVVLAVTASDGGDAGAVADGDEETAWTADATNGAWVVLTLADEVDVGDIEVVGGNLPEGIRFLLSEDAEEWTEAVPGRAWYVWVVFPASGEAVAVKEIRVLSE